MEAPPPEVMTAVLRGGLYDRLVFEIEEGQTEIKVGPKNAIEGGPDLPVAKYAYGGSQDDDGNAVFEVVAD